MGKIVLDVTSSNLECNTVCLCIHCSCGTVNWITLKKHHGTLLDGMEVIRFLIQKDEAGFSCNICRYKMDSKRVLRLHSYKEHGRRSTEGTSLLLQHMSLQDRDREYAEAAYIQDT